MELSNKGSLRTINIISIAVPIVVAILLGIRSKPYLGDWTKLLPHLNAVLNGTTSILLLLGLYLIKKKEKDLHRAVMTSAFILGGVFLVSYVIYHLTNESVSFGGDGIIRYFYYFILISHISLSLIVLPLVLRAFYFAYVGDFGTHVKLVKYAYPIWFYVSFTGVLAYLLISPYYV